MDDPGSDPDASPLKFVAGTLPMCFGGFEAQRTSSLAAWDCAGAVAILTHFPQATLWISGEWKPLCRITNSVWSLK
jgi:hypothetical protein